MAERFRKHNIFSHFCRDCDVCLTTQITRAPCRTRTGEAQPRAEKFCDLIRADHKVLNEECESRNSHRYAVVVQGLATQWIQSYQWKKPRLHRKQKSACGNFSNHQKSQRSFTLTVLWNLQNLVKTYLGIIGRQHLIGPRRVALLNERYEE